MGILFDTLTTQPEQRARVVRDAEKVLDAEVSDKRGMSGLAIKGAFKVLTNLQPGVVPKMIDDLLEDFARQIEPFWDRWRAENDDTSCKQFFIANGDGVADALLSITDGRAEKTRHAPLKKIYLKLRPTAKEHVVDSMPRVGALIERHTEDLA